VHPTLLRFGHFWPVLVVTSIPVLSLIWEGDGTELGERYSSEKIRYHHCLMYRKYEGKTLCSILYPLPFSSV